MLQLPQGSPADVPDLSFSQFSERAKIRAALVLPQPLGPENKYALAMRPFCMEFFSVETTNSCPANSSKVFGRRFVAVTSYTEAAVSAMGLVYMRNGKVKREGILGHGNQ